MTEHDATPVPDQTPDQTPDETPDEAQLAAAMSALRAADPAAGVPTDQAAIGARVAAGMPDTALAVPDELAARRRRRIVPRWAQAAAAVAAVAVVGTGGYAVGASGGDTSSVAGALPAITLNQGSAGNAPVAEAAGAAGTDSARSSMDTKMSSSYGFSYGWHTVFRDGGLPSATGTGAAWAFDPAGVASAATATRVATALGVIGDARVEWGSWVVGPNDGTGPSVTVSGDGQASASFYDPTRDPWACSTDAQENPSAGVVAPAAGVCDGSTVTPTGDAAIERARQALTAIGVDTTSTQVSVQADTGDTTTAAARYVYETFAHVLDGALTGVQWSVTLVGDGVQNLWGPLAPLVELGTYDVISPAQAVERMNDPRFGSSGGVMPMARAESEGVATDAVVAPDDSTAEPVVPTVPAAGAAISWPVTEVTLVSARLGVALTTLPSGAAMLVPTYELTDSDGGTWSVIAVADSQLDFAPVG